jgi:prepilin-type N-terminal cleavage/methylation domain-containing protein
MRSQRGMTLVEVLIVLAIIGILANVAYPQLDSALWKSRAAVVISDYRLFEAAVVDYMSVHGVYPPNASVANRTASSRPTCRRASGGSNRDRGSTPTSGRTGRTRGTVGD